MEHGVSQSIGVHAQSMPRTGKNGAAKKELLPKHRGDPLVTLQDRTKKQLPEGHKVPSHSRDLQAPQGKQPNQNQAVMTPKSSTKGVDGWADPVEAPSEARSERPDLPTAKKEDEKPKAESSNSLPFQNLREPEQLENLGALRQPHKEAVTEPKDRVATIVRREQRGQDQRPTGSIKLGENVSAVPRSPGGGASLEQKYQSDEEKASMGRDYHAYKVAYEKYLLAGRRYQKRVEVLSRAEDSSYLKYAGKHRVKVQHGRRVNGKPTVTFANEEHDYKALTPPSHKKLQPYAGAIISAAEHTLQLRRKLERNHPGRCHPMLVSKAEHLRQFKDVEDALKEKNLLLQDHRKQAQQPHRIGLRKVQSNAKPDASPSKRLPNHERSCPKSARVAALNARLPQINTSVPPVPQPKPKPKPKSKPSAKTTGNVTKSASSSPPPRNRTPAPTNTKPAPTNTTPATTIKQPPSTNTPSAKGPSTKQATPSGRKDGSHYPRPKTPAPAEGTPKSELNYSPKATPSVKKKNISHQQQPKTPPLPGEGILVPTLNSSSSSSQANPSAAEKKTSLTSRFRKTPNLHKERNPLNLS